MSLQAGMKAPDFSGETLAGHQISLDTLRGKNVFLKFHRYSSCPVCNLHMGQYVKSSEDLTKAGITTVAVFHSPRSSLEKSLKAEVPFEVIADPDKQIFRLYEVEESWKGMFALKLWADYARAIAKGFLSKPFGNEGGDKGHPADFLIDGEGVIRYAHYGKHYADSLTVSDSLRIVQELDLPPVQV